MILDLERPTGGRVLLQGRSIHDLQGNAKREYRALVQAVFQDPWASLNPRMTVGKIIGKALVVNKCGSREEIRRRVADLLVEVG